MSEYIELKGINKVFVTKRSEIYALQDIDMKFKKGEFVSIVGPSGCGKSTIIRLIDDIIKPTNGTITVDGHTYNNEELPKEFIKKMGFIFQVPNLYPWLTIKENVMLPLRIYGLNGEEYEKRTQDLLKYVGLESYANKYPSAISGGMAQRIGVIRGMVHNPEILMMDEPFGALDALTRQNMQTLIRKIWSQTQNTVFLITHDVDEALALATRVIVMSSRPGRIVKQFETDFTYDIGGVNKESARYTREYMQIREEILNIINEQNETLKL